MELVVTSRTTRPVGIEIVERKGRGHPDTLTDHLAEALSSAYCRYTLERFGEVLYHNFDKVGLLGGKSVVEFGYGELTEPIRVLLNGRAADTYYGERIPLRDLLSRWTEEFLLRELPLLSAAKDLAFHYNVSNSNTAGYPADDFGPISARPGLQRIQILSSDTAAICVHFPLSSLEQVVLSGERMLANDAFRAGRPWLGSDIKILAVRHASRVDVTACVPQIARFVACVEEYQAHLEEIRDLLLQHLSNGLPELDVRLTLNTKDDHAAGSYFLTAIGSCIESGDEGMVGRGNRPCGVIPVTRSFSGEAACGKNPVFFPGKVYNVVATAVAKRLYERSGVPLEVWLVAQEGRTLRDPWWVMVLFEGDPVGEREVSEVLREELDRIPEHTRAMIEGRVELC